MVEWPYDVVALQRFCCAQAQSTALRISSTDSVLGLGHREDSVHACYEHANQKEASEQQHDNQRLVDSHLEEREANTLAAIQLCSVLLQAVDTNQVLRSELIHNSRFSPLLI